MLSRIDFSIQSSTVKTDIIEKIPIVIPKSERNVLNLLTIIELIANKNPSFNNLRNIFTVKKNYWNAKDTKIAESVLILQINLFINNC